MAGYYVQDEPSLAVQAETFDQYALIKGGDPSGFNLAVSNHPLNLPYWKDTIDVIGVDPYPIQYAANNNLAEVADWTRLAVQTVQGARPVWTVIQFFQGTTKSQWPTEQQLHDMSWMAIAEGANGLFYWSYGLRGLYSVRNPTQSAALYQELIDVTSEIKSLEPMLLMPDAPVLTANSAAGTIVTKTKDLGNGTRYVIAYNHSASALSATFTLAQPAATVTVHDEPGAAVTRTSASNFSMTFAPYQAHVFQLSNATQNFMPNPQIARDGN